MLLDRQSSKFVFDVKQCNHGGAKMCLRTEASKPARQWVDEVLAFDGMEHQTYDN